MNNIDYPQHATIEVFREGYWQPIARFRPAKPETGYRGASGFGRQQWLNQFELADGATSDWPIQLSHFVSKGSE